MNSKRVLDSKQWLKAIFKNSLKLEIEFARLSLLNFQISHLVGMLLVFIEYAQLISQCILFNPFFLNDPTFNDDTFIKVAIFVAKLFNPGHFLQQDKIGSLTITIFTALILMILLRIFLLCYVSYIATAKLKGQPFLLKLWQWIFHFQSKVIYFFVSSFWINAFFLIKADGSFDVFRIGKKGMLALSIVMVAIEFLFSAVLQIRYFYALPVGKDLFSAKSNITGTINLIQKLFIQIIHIALPVNTLSTDWIMSVVGLCFSLLRSAEFYLKLPLYQIRALIFEGSLIAAILSMNLVCVMQAIMRSLNSKENNIQFMLVAWIILSILAVKVSFGFLKKSIVGILKDNNSSRPELFVHKISFIKELQRFHNKPNKQTAKYDWYYLLHTMVNVNIQKILMGNNENIEENLDINSKEDLNKLILNYLQYLSDTFPKDKFIKLYLAYFYGIKLKSFGNCIRCIKESNLDGSNWKSGLTASLLILKIQDIIQASVKQQDDKINLNIYLEGLTLFDSLEERILNQTELQIKLYREVLSDTPDLANIFNFSQRIKSTRQRIEKTMDLLARDIPEVNISPLLLYADYQLKINHSMKEYRNYQKIYEKRHQKYVKHFEKDELNKHNAYQQTTALVIVGTQKQDSGKIIYGSKALDSLYGGNLHIGANSSTFLPPSLRNFVADTRNTVSNNNDRSRLQTNIKTYGYHQEGYLIPVTVYTDLFPIMTEGLYLMMMIRPIPLTQDYFLVRENGDIESPTENIAKKLGLPSSISTLTNLRALSEELAQVNEAFNFLASLEKKRANGFDQCFIPRKKQVMSKVILDETEAKELVREFTEEGRAIELASMKDDPKKFMYYCNFQSLSFGSTTLRLISLKEMSCENCQYSDDIRFESEELSKDDEDFELEDEKQNGWIPLETLSPSKMNYRHSIFSVRDTLGPTVVGETFQTMEDHLLTPKSNHGFLLKESVVATPFIPEKNFLKAPTSPKMILSSTRDRNLEENRRIRVVEQRALSVASSQQSRMSNRKRVEEAFQTALTIKYYPKSWLCLFVMFYFAAVAIFTIQLSSKLFVESAFRNFELKKDILVDSGTRNSLLLQSQIVIRIGLDFGSGFIDINKIGRLAEAAAALNTTTALYIQGLETANNNILRKVSGLEKSMKTTLFNQSVRVYELQQSINEEATFIKMNSFEATNAVVHIALKFFAFMKAENIEGAFYAFLTFTRNSLNDLLIETENISAVFFESIDNQSDNIIQLLRVFLIIILAWIFCVLLSFVFIIRRLYKEEKTNMLAVTKLNRSVIKRICSEMVAFEIKLKGKTEQFLKEESVATIKETNKVSQQKNSSTMKKPNANGIRKKYTIYFLMLSPFIILSVVLSVVNSVLVGNSVNELEDLKSLFNFASSIKVSASIGYISVMELFFSNNTSFIKNELPLVQIQNQIQAIQSLRTGGLGDFSLGSKIPTFQSLMFGNPCATIKNSPVDLYCSILDDYGKSSGIVNLMNILEEMLADKKSQYLVSDKSIDEIKEIQLEELDLFTSAYQVLSFECDMFSNDVNAKFEQMLENSQRDRNLIFELFAVVLLAEGVFFWMTVLKKLKEASNQFKNVLQTFPSNLVLSNFLLKIFLVNTSKGFLDLSIKSDL